MAKCHTATYDETYRQTVGQAKQATSVRLTVAGRTRIAERAERADVDFSHMVRRMLAYADRHMPDGWVPSKTSNSGDGR